MLNEPALLLGPTAGVTLVFHAFPLAFGRNTACPDRKSAATPILNDVGLQAVF